MNLLIFATFNCNNRCPYCWQLNDTKLKSLKTHTGEEWLAAIAKYFPKLDFIDFSGGEPTILPGFWELVKGLAAKKYKVSMTTNLTFPIVKIAGIPKKTFDWITCSLHPSEKMPDDIFFNKVAEMKRQFGRVGINFVLYPPHLGKLREYESRARAIDVPFHKDPPAGMKLTKDEKKQISCVASEDRVEGFTKPSRKVKCTAGADRMIIYPDGSVYSCLGLMKPLGNIFDGTYKHITKMIDCNKYPSKCASCDRDHVRVEEQ